MNDITMDRTKLILCVFLTFLTLSLLGQGDNETIKFKELYDIIKTRVPEISESQIEAAAVEGILNKFSNYVHIVSEDSAQQTNQTTIKTLLFEENIAYFKFTNINQELSEKFSILLSEIEKTNKLKGIILDLRFCGGKDYAAAAKLADLFYTEEKPLFIAGNTKYSSTKKTNAIEVPTIILVNSETSAGAEAFAGALKDCKNILIIGNNTKGKAFSYSDIKLSNGKILRVASSRIKISNGELFPTNGLKPEITVDVSLEEERQFIDDPYKLPKRLAAEGESTSRLTRPRLNEDELVKMKKEGIDYTSPTTEREKVSKPEPKIVYDPVLSRAIDILKVLTIIGFERIQK